jgi:hypothetical protein
VDDEILHHIAIRGEMNLPKKNVKKHKITFLKRKKNH